MTPVTVTNRAITVDELRTILQEIPPDYAVVLEADDCVPTFEWRVVRDDAEKTVRFTSWEV